MTVASQITSYLQTQLEKIILGNSTTNYRGSSYTFQTNAGAQVSINQEYTEHSDIMPQLVLISSKNNTQFDGEVELGMENHQLDISIEGMIADDRSGAEGDKLIQDVITVVKQDPYFGDLVLELNSFATESTINVADEIVSFIKISFTALYTVPFGSE